MDWQHSRQACGEQRGDQPQPLHCQGRQIGDACTCAPAPRKPRAASVEDSRTSVTMEALEEGDEEEETGSIDRRHAARMQRAATVEDSRGAAARGDGGAGKRASSRGARIERWTERVARSVEEVQF